MLYKSANVCESESYVRLSMYSAALKVGFFFSISFIESSEFNRNYSESFLFNQSHEELNFVVPMYVTSITATLVLNLGGGIAQFL